MRLTRLFRPTSSMLVKLRNAGLIIILAVVGFTALAQSGRIPEMALTTTPTFEHSATALPATWTPTPTPFPPPEMTFEPIRPPFIPTIPPDMNFAPTPIPFEITVIAPIELGSIEGNPIIRRGEEVSDTLSAQQTSLFYNYEANAGEIVIFQLIAQPPLPTLWVNVSFGPEYIYDPLPVDENGNNILTLAKVIHNNGTYTLRLDSADPFGPPRSFILRRVVPEVPSLTLGESQEGRVGLPLPVTVYGFNGEADMLISLTSQSEYPTQITLIYLSDFPDESAELISSNYGYGYGTSNIDLFRLPHTGNYAVVVKRLYYYTDNLPTSPQPYTLMLNEVIPIEIAYGDTVEGLLTNETPAVYYSFDGRYGDVISARVETEGGVPDTLLTLYAPERYEIYSDDDSSLGLDPEIYRFPLTQFSPEQQAVGSASHILRVRATQFEDFGPFSLTLNNTTAELGEEPVRWRWNNKGLVNTYYIEGEAGETLLLKLRVLRGANTPNINVMQGANQLLYVTATTLEAVEATFTVPQDGRVLVTLDSGGRFLESEISVTRVEP